MLPLNEAISALEDISQRINRVKKVGLGEALGYVLAEDAVAIFDQPPFPRSPLDGYAVRGADLAGASEEAPCRLKVIGRAYAGEYFTGQIQSGEALRIMTGAPIPAGADTVIRQEWTDYGEDHVSIYRESKPFADYCAQGEDYRQGDVLLKKGQKLDSISIAVLSSLGMAEVAVFDQPRLAVIATGDEVIEPGDALTPGKIYDSNLYYISSRLRELGIEPSYMLHCGDDPEEMIALIRRLCGGQKGELSASENNACGDQEAPMSAGETASCADRNVDLIITTGGVSVGVKDIMHEVLERLPAEKLFWRVEVKPGAPTLAGRYQGVPLLCLSGNPFGAAVNFELLARPMLAKMTGKSELLMKKEQLPLQNAFTKRGIRRFLRARADQGTVSLPNPKHESGILSSMLGCNCLLEIEPERDGVQAGELVWVHYL